MFLPALTVVVVLQLRKPIHREISHEGVGLLGSSDRPLEPGDNDTLGLNEIAAALSKFIRNEKTEPPLTIAVTGDWGTGKSSLMNLLRSDLVRRGFRPVWFNAWHHQQEDQMLASLLSTIRQDGIPTILQFFRMVRFRSELALLRAGRRLGIVIPLCLMVSASLAYVWQNPVLLTDAIGLSSVETLVAGRDTRQLSDTQLDELIRLMELDAHLPETRPSSKAVEIESGAVEIEVEEEFEAEEVDVPGGPVKFRPGEAMEPVSPDEYASRLSKRAEEAIADSTSENVPVEGTDRSADEARIKQLVDLIQLEIRRRDLQNLIKSEARNDPAESALVSNGPPELSDVARAEVRRRTRKLAASLHLYPDEDPPEDSSAMAAPTPKTTSPFTDISAMFGAIGGTIALLIAAVRGLTAFGVKPGALLASVSGTMKVKDLSAQAGFRHQFAAEFRDVTSVLKPRTLIVVIDDLDRCQPKNVMQVMEMVNFLVSSGDCIVVMGMAKDRIVRCIANEFDDLVTGTDQSDQDNDTRLLRFARDYLEKIINVEVATPRLEDAEAQRMVDTAQTEGVQASLIKDRTRVVVTIDRVATSLRKSGHLLAVTTAIVCGLLIGSSLVPASSPHNELTPSQASETRTETYSNDDFSEIERWPLMVENAEKNEGLVAIEKQSIKDPLSGQPVEYSSLGTPELTVRGHSYIIFSLMVVACLAVVTWA